MITVEKTIKFDSGFESSKTFGRNPKFFSVFRNLKLMNILEIANLLETELVK